MIAERRLFVCLLIVTSLAVLAGCQDGSSSSADAGSRSFAKDFTWLPLYGDGTNDSSDRIARVGDIVITARDLELYREELSNTKQTLYSGPDGERLLLKQMVEKVLMAQAAVDKELYNDPDVARSIISTRRNHLASAMINYGLLRDQEPSLEEAREYFLKNRRQYRQLTLVNARHIECLNEKAAQEAYQRLVQGGKGNDWISVMSQSSVNVESGAIGGSVGWFNPTGVIPYIKDSGNFIRQAVDLENGLHPPFKVSDRWHVVEILKRDNERPMTFQEAVDQVKKEMLPAWQETRVQDFLREARKTQEVEMMGNFAPGRGLSADELFSRALTVADPQRKIELLNLIYTDYPESGRADDALFMAATVALEAWVDAKYAEQYLRLLLEEYPDSEFTDDAQFLKDNLNNPDVLNPQSIEELRQ